MHVWSSRCFCAIIFIFCNREYDRLSKNNRVDNVHLLGRDMIVERSSIKGCRKGIDLRSVEDHVKWLTKDLQTPRSRGKKNRAALMERSFGFSEPTDHFISIPSLPAKKSNCFLMSDNEEILSTYRNLPCLRPCCTDLTKWSDCAATCQLARYTGKWKFYHFTNKRGGPVHDLN